MTPAPKDRRAPAAPSNGTAANGTPPAAEGQTQRRRLSDFLLAEGLITAEQFTLVVAEQKRSNEKLPVVVVRMGLMNED